jgi:hypothetical protein
LKSPLLENTLMMATITLEYDAHNKNIHALLEVIMNLGAIAVNPPLKKSSIDQALEDVKKGRVYKAENARTLIADCLK